MDEKLPEGADCQGHRRGQRVQNSGRGVEKIGRRRKEKVFRRGREAEELASVATSKLQVSCTFCVLGFLEIMMIMTSEESSR